MAGLRALALAVGCSLALPLAHAAPATTLPTVDLGYAVHQPFLNGTGGYYNFSNIRYAEPPLGNLRFAAPVPPQSVNRTVNDGSQGVICPQSFPSWALLAEGINPSEVHPDPRTNEDCLFLDVVVPESIFNARGNGSRAPVLVWIYGGGYVDGDKSGSAAGLLAASEKNGNGGVIFVAMNYRLGAFGWLSGPTFQANGTANAGLYDQRLALEWIQRYIPLFGGDPNRVTVLGESAGGGSIMHQITAYGGNKGPVPFQQAIPQSPGWVPLPTNLEQEQTFQRYLMALNVSSIQEARGLPYAQLQAANVAITASSTYGTFTFGPTVDGNFVPALPGILLLHGQFDHNLTLLIGHNTNEGLIFTYPFLNETTFEASLHSNLPDISPDYFDYVTQVLYPPIFNGSYAYTSQFARASLITSELIFICNTNYLARAFNNRTYNYVFSVPPGIHGEDVPYTFFNGPIISVIDDPLAVTLQEYITTFAETGTPNSAALPQFPVYGPTGVALDLNVTGVTPFHDPAANARCLFWQKALYY